MRGRHSRNGCGLRVANRRKVLTSACDGCLKIGSVLPQRPSTERSNKYLHVYHRLLVCLQDAVCRLLARAARSIRCESFHHTNTKPFHPIMTVLSVLSWLHVALTRAHRVSQGRISVIFSRGDRVSPAVNRHHRKGRSILVRMTPNAHELLSYSLIK